jgi:hypothetical protein
MISGELVVEIDLREFWDWASKYIPDHHEESIYGKPYIENDCICFDVAIGNDPETWAEKPKAVTSWEAPDAGQRDEA